MAEKVAGDMYQSITGQLFEIGRQLRQSSGYPFSPEALKVHLQDAIEGHFNGAVTEAKKLLELVTTTNVAAIESFKAADHFKVNTKKAKVRIALIGDNFKKNFLGLSEGPCKETHIVTYKLLRLSYGFSIIKELGYRCEIKLSQFFALLQKQGRGEVGAPLLMNGDTNIAHIRDVNGKLWSVGAGWASIDNGWHIEAVPINSLVEWNGGTQVLADFLYRP